MAHPKRRHSRSRRDKRRSQWKLKAKTPSKCPQCGHLNRTHSICPECGFYRGQQRVTIKTVEEKEKK